MGHIEIIKILCENGANPEMEKINGGRGIHIVTEANQTKALQIFLEYCHPNIEAKLANDTVALYLAAQFGYTEVK